MKRLLTALFLIGLAVTGTAAVRRLDYRSARTSPSVAFAANSAADEEKPSKALLRHFTASSADAPTCGELSAGDELEIELFDDVSLKITLGERQPDPLGGGEAFSAKFEDADLSSATVVRTADGLQITAQLMNTNRLYTISTGEGRVQVSELDTAAVGETNDIGIEPPELTEAEREEEHALRSLVAARAKNVAESSTLTYVDMLFAYDSAAAQWAKTNRGGITNFANTALAKMNTVLANTGLTSSFKYRLAGVTAVNTSSKDFSQTLENIRYGNGSWAPIKAMREKIGADIVTTFINIGSGSGTTGIGYVYTSDRTTSFPASAYNVCSVQHADSGYVVSHEVGHNMGAGHSNKQAASPGPQYYSYSSGYYFTSGGTKYHTVMAYNSDGYGNFYQPAPLFSSPNYKYKNVTAGTSLYNDNSRTLQQNYLAVSQFRVPSTSLTVAFDANGGVVSASSRSYVVGSTYVTFPTATRSGYTFEGWYTSATGGTRVYSWTTVAASVTKLYAHWSGNPDLFFRPPSGMGWPAAVFLTDSTSSLKAVTSFSQGDTIYLRYSIGNQGAAAVTTAFTFLHKVVNASGETVASYAEASSEHDLLKAGGCSYLSSGWKLPSLQGLSAGTYTYTCVIDSKSTVTESDEGNNTYSLKFSVVNPTTVTVAFDACGGSVSPASRTYAIGSAYGSLPTPTYSGHNFVGWYTLASGGTRMTAATVASASVTKLYAHWMTDGDDGGGTSSDDDFTIEDGVLVEWKGTGSTAVTIPSTVREIGTSAFRQSAATSVRIPSSVRKICDLAFCLSSSLTEVTVEGSNLRDIGGQAFAFTDLQKISIPDTVTNIGYCAFSGCDKLTSITLPSSLKRISWGTFQNCSSLKSVYYRCAKQPAFEFSFSTTQYKGANANLVTYVPTGSTGWNGTAGSSTLPSSWPVGDSDARAIRNWTPSQSTTEKPDLFLIPALYWPSSVYTAKAAKTYTSETSFKVGEPIYFYLCFKNGGKVATSTSYIIRHEVWSSAGQRVASFDYTDTSTVYAGDCRCWFGSGWSQFQNLPAGSYVYKVTMDATNAIVESDEGNNTASCTFTVGDGDDGGGDGGGDGGDDGETYGPFGGDADVIRDQVSPTMIVQMAVSINGQTAAKGDCVAVYRSDTGALCGLGRILDDSGRVTLSLQIKSGVKLHFKVWQAASGEDGEILEGDDACDLTSPTPGSLLMNRTLSVTPASSLSLVLSGAKWHQVSFNVKPADDSIADVFAPVRDKVSFVTHGSSYWSPSYGGNLSGIAIGEGYWVLTTAAATTWTLTGVPDPSAQISVEKGWNLIGYTPQASGSPATVLKSALSAGKIKYISYGGELYPGSMTTMQPGRGYWVYAESAGSFTYDAASAASVAAAASEATFGPFGTLDDVVCQPVAPVVLADMPVTVWGETAVAGDCVAAYLVDTGDLCGLGRVDRDGKVSIPIQADQGSRVSFSVWRQADGLDGEVLEADENCCVELNGDVMTGCAVTVSQPVETVTVTFVANGGTLGWSSQTYTVGETYGLFPDVFAADGYAFDGWYTALEGGEQVTIQSIASAAVIRLYARWERLSADCTLSLVQGWNWISVNVTPTDASPDAVFAGVSFADNDVIKSSDGAATYYGGVWYGELKALRPGVAYMVKKSTAGAARATVAGDAADEQIDVAAGWNWLGPTSAEAVPLEDLAHSAGFTDNDVINSPNDSATYYGGAWYGTLKSLAPGAGYKARFAKGGVLTF